MAGLARTGYLQRLQELIRGQENYKNWPRPRKRTGQVVAACQIAFSK